MQQIARELPALAMGPQMFFLAISNNIPMFTDALASARKEYEALTAAGKKATPVWKQVLSPCSPGRRQCLRQLPDCRIRKGDREFY